ncbi:hypothetical protein BV210_01570 [Halorientalis sp. IM1011]|uniref:DUF7269 family protein n=1 Tax=Halorientalis sp. IM1011 TaxID=1932360 RepID=UPI00097CC5EA|nr:hypothetical protein [Halorientalis sp. IM1011]AQL41481.1 hypothetical protein BV210_01570 [Halorientalis sp. IM1011]
MTGRRVGLLVGGLLFALALVAVLFDGVAAIGSSGWLARPGNDYLLAAGVGAVIVLAGVGVVTARSLSGFDGATPPQAEEVPAGSPLGEEVDRAISGDIGVRAHLRGDERTAVRERLRSAVVETLVRAEGCSRPEARQRIARREWTDDRTAAAFLSEQGPGSLGTRLTDALPGGSRFQHRSERTVAAVLDLAEGES